MRTSLTRALGTGDRQTLLIVGLDWWPLDSVFGDNRHVEDADEREGRRKREKGYKLMDEHAHVKYLIGKPS